METPKETTNKKTTTKKVDQSTKDASIKKKAKSEIQKKAQTKKTNEPAKAKQDKKSESSYIDVPSRKDVKGIPRAKLEVFNKKDSFSVPSKDNNKRVGNHEYWQQGELDLNNKTEKKESKKAESENKIKDDKKKVTDSKNDDKQNTQVKSILKVEPKVTPKSAQKPVAKSASKSQKNTVSKPAPKAVKKTKTKSTSNKTKTPIQRKKSNKKNSLNINKDLVIILSIIILAILSYFLIVKEDVFSIFDKEVQNINTETDTIVVPKQVDDDFDSDFVYVGDSLKDLDTLNLKVKETENDTTDQVDSIINIEDEKLSGDYIKLQIDNGLSATAIASLLEENGVCNKEDFLKYVVENKLETKLRSGLYIIKKNSSISEIVTSIVDSDSTIVKIYPASTIDQVDKLLTSRKLISKGDFVKACTQLAQDKGLNFVEGWFSPATYKITNDFDVNMFANIMLENTFKILSPYIKDIAKSGYSIDEIIIIASLIQGETQDVDQMPIISSVIHNRLEEDMPLGIDATTRYEIGNWSDELTQEILDKITPYNTRRKKGLPPGGICLSSKDALISAIYPKDTDFLYYIHDKDGNLITAYTYKEHLENIEKRDNK